NRGSRTLIVRMIPRPATGDHQGCPSRPRTGLRVGPGSSPMVRRPRNADDRTMDSDLPLDPPPPSPSDEPWLPPAAPGDAADPAGPVNPDDPAAAGNAAETGNTADSTGTGADGRIDSAGGDGGSSSSPPPPPPPGA